MSMDVVYETCSSVVPLACQWVAAAWWVDLDVAVVRKFNAVSDARKIGVRL